MTSRLITQKDWKSILEIAEQNAMALCRNGKQIDEKSFEFIYFSEEYRSAIIHLSEDEMTDFQKQQKRIVMSSDMESWIQLMYIHAKGERWNGLKNSLYRWV